MGLRCLVFLTLFAPFCHAQSPAATAPVEFEVAALKPTADLSLPGRITRPVGGVGYHGTNMPLMSYIRVAYQVRDSQISGPEWLNTDHFDLEAKADRPASVDELHTMLQHLLEERFHMKVRREMRDQSGYALVVEKGGPKMATHPIEDKETQPIRSGSGPHTGTNVTMTYLAFFLSNELDKTVVDKTGLDGHYDFEVTWAGDNMSPMMAASDHDKEMRPEERMAMAPGGMTLFDALKKQLGLRLDPAKVPVEHLVIEHIEGLKEN